MILSFLSILQNDVIKENNFTEKVLNNEERADGYLKRFNGIYEANEFILTFNSYSICASRFIKSFNSSKESLEHLEKTGVWWKTNNLCENNCKWMFDENIKTLFIIGSGK